MNNKTLYKTNDFVSYLKNNDIEVVVDSTPDKTTIDRIKKLIKNKENLFSFQRSLFN